MEVDDLLCSRNARPEKALVGRAQWKINQPPSLRDNEQARKGACLSFDARSVKLIRAILGATCTSTIGRITFGHSLRSFYFLPFTSNLSRFLGLRLAWQTP
jgi:hypothetical protein